MKKKMIAILFVSMFLLTSFSAVGTKINLNQSYAPEDDIYKKRTLGLIPEENPTIRGRSFSGVPPDSFDWRNYNGHDWTTPIKDQGECNSCYAFAATAALESVYKIENNKPNLDVDFAEQFIVSCGQECSKTSYNKPYDIRGCAGGSTYSTLEFFNKEGMIKESYFNYQAKDEDSYDEVICHDKEPGWSVSLIRIHNYGYVQGTTTPSKTDIKNALIESGPLPTKMYVYEDFYGSNSNIAHYPDKTEWPNDVYYHKYGKLVGSGLHAVVIVGFKDDDGVKDGGYWFCKNSWGEEWGIKNPYDDGNNGGWFKIAYNDCYIRYDTLYLSGIYDPAGVAEIYSGSSLSWKGVKPGSTITDNFFIQNTGESGSNIKSWSVGRYSPWGSDWTFEPSSGNNLGINDPAVDVKVTVTAPEGRGVDSDGFIKINTCDCYNSDIIDANVKTTVKSRPLFFFRLFFNFLFD